MEGIPDKVEKPKRLSKILQKTKSGLKQVQSVYYGYGRLKNSLYQLFPWILLASSYLALSITKDPWVFGYFFSTVLTEVTVYILTYIAKNSVYGYEDFVQLLDNGSTKKNQTGAMIYRNPLAVRPCILQSFKVSTGGETKDKYCREEKSGCVTYPLPSFDRIIGLPNSHVTMGIMSYVFWALYLYYNKYDEKESTLTKDFVIFSTLTASIVLPIIWYHLSKKFSGGQRTAITVFLTILLLVMFYMFLPEEIGIFVTLAISILIPLLWHQLSTGCSSITQLLLSAVLGTLLGGFFYWVTDYGVKIYEDIQDNDDNDDDNEDDNKDDN